MHICSIYILLCLFCDLYFCKDPHLSRFTFSGSFVFQIFSVNVS